MAKKKSQQDKAKKVALRSSYDDLVDLCKKGMLYEAEDWLQAGNSSSRPEDHRECVLCCVTARGFHSFVKLLLQYDCTDAQKLSALEVAAQNGALEICRLLVEAGAPVAELQYEYLDDVIRRPLIEYLLDHGLDLTRNNGLARMFVYRRVKPLLGIFLQNRQRFPKWEEQAAIALCEFIRKRDKKWISMMIWAGADPLLPVPELSDYEDNFDDEMELETALQVAANNGLEVFTMLKIEPTPDQATGILKNIWNRSNPDMVRFLILAGGSPNAYSPEEGSLLYIAVHSFAVRNIWRRPRTTPEEDIEHISWLIRQGAKWVPAEDHSNLNWLRLKLYQQEGEHVVEILRLLHAGDCCEISFLREFVDKPKMKEWIRTFDSPLYEKLVMGS